MPSRFVITLPISCVICSNAVRNPASCPKGHVFCLDCIERWLMQNDHCPICRAKISHETPMLRLFGHEKDKQSTDSGENGPTDLQLESRRLRHDMWLSEYESDIKSLQDRCKYLAEENESLKEDTAELREVISRACFHAGPEGPVRPSVRALKEYLDSTHLTHITVPIGIFNNLIEEACSMALRVAKSEDKIDEKIREVEAEKKTMAEIKPDIDIDYIPHEFIAVHSAHRSGKSARKRRFARSPIPTLAATLKRHRK